MAQVERFLWSVLFGLFCLALLWMALYFTGKVSLSLPS